MPDRAPDAVVEETMPLNMPLIYRLMGDWHQQHIDFAYTEQTGLARPIAHGVSLAASRCATLSARSSGRAGAHEAL